MSLRAGFLTWPRENRNRLSPTWIVISRFLRPTPRGAVTRHAHPCGSAHAVGGPDLAALPPRPWARRRFASGVSAPSAIRSIQRSGFPRRCTFRLRRRRSTSTATSIVGTEPIESMILAHPCRAGARQSRHSSCDEKRNAGALAGHWVLVLHRCRCGANGACATPVPRECEPRSCRRLAATARLRGPTAPRGGIRRDVGSSPFSFTAEHPSSPETPASRDGDPRDTCAPPAKTRQRMWTPRRATLPANRGAIRHRSLVRGPSDAFAPFGPKRIAPPGALLERAEARRDETLRARSLDAFSTRGRRRAERCCSRMPFDGHRASMGSVFRVLGGLPRLRHPTTAASTTTSTTDCFRG